MAERRRRTKTATARRTTAASKTATKRRAKAKRPTTRRRRVKPLAAMPTLLGTECVVTLDVSSQCVGFAVFQARALAAYGKFRPEGEDHGAKLGHFRGWLEALLADWQPDHVVVEQPYPGRRRFTYGVLMMYIGAVLEGHYAALTRELPKTHRIPPHTIKRALGVSKGASHAENKEIMVCEINRRYGIKLRYRRRDTTKKTSDDDIADAIALGEAWYALAGTPLDTMDAGATPDDGWLDD